MANKAFKIIFHKDILLLIFAIVWLWFTVSSIVDKTTGLSQMKQHMGELNRAEIVITKIKNKPLFKDTTREIRLYLVNSESYFTITTNNDYRPILSELYQGDNILTIYTKQKLFGIFGFGDEKKVNHLQRGNKTIVDYSKHQRSMSAIVWLTGLATIGFTVAFVIRLRKRLYGKL
ncbi:MAG TPA: hypothetical protein VJU78_16245 [Chitinophagaceae bacterium]|nr:hypothetical protein [Chitinophagaceae bacterium]